MPTIPSGSALQSRRLDPRGLTAGAKAGVSVGTIAGCALIMLCLWPVIARFIRRRRRRHAPSETASVAGPPSVSDPPMAQVQGDSGERRMSTDSFRPGPMHRQSTKDVRLGSFGGTEASTPPTPLTSVGIAGGPHSGSPISAPPHIDTNLAQTVASSGSRGYSDSYYNTDIPTEAFGLPKWDDKQASRSGLTRSSSKFSASSLFGSLFRRGTTSQKTTGASGDNITPLGLSESPTQLEPPANILSRSSHSSRSSRSSHSSRSSEEGGRGLDLGDIEFPAVSPPPAPPLQPSPGTVNPMEVMGATTKTEQTWRTNAELMNLSVSPPSHSTYADPSTDVFQYAEAQPVPNGNQTAYVPPQSPEEFIPEGFVPEPVFLDYYPDTNYVDGGDHPDGPEFALTEPIPDVLVKDGVSLPTTALDVVPPLNSQTPHYPRHRYTSSADIYYTDNSTYSTPFPAHSPSGASTLNTPDTRISDATPSPKPVGLEMKHGSSPNSGLSSSPQTPQVLVCNKCNQKFDQPHKLNHHKRYHDRPHVCERPGCGKRFGTKTHLDRHVNDKHEQTRRYHCPEQSCSYSRHGGKSFPRKDNLRRHMNNIHHQSPQPDQEFEFVDVVMAGS